MLPHATCVMWGQGYQNPRKLKKFSQYQVNRNIEPCELQVYAVTGAGAREALLKRLQTAALKHMGLTLAGEPTNITP